jgi:hypothetical protein
MVALTLCVPETEREASGSLRDRFDERDIIDLITAYREGATALSRRC